MRTNIYKEKILTILKKAHLLSIPAIQAKLPKADFSTIFRNLEQLCKADIVRKVTISKDTILYEMAESHHRHDHFVCTDCGVIESVHAPKIPLRGKAVTTDVLIKGKCDGCVA